MRLFFAIIIALSSVSFSLLADGAEFSFLSRNHDFPDSNEGTLLTHDFVFTNTGNAPLIISSYAVACSCTKITYSESPILPGEKSKIHLTFDTKGKYGFQSRKIEIFSNAKRKLKLSFRVFVVRSE